MPIPQWLRLTLEDGRRCYRHTVYGVSVTEMSDCSWVCHNQHAPPRAQVVTGGTAADAVSMTGWSRLTYHHGFPND